MSGFLAAVVAAGSGLGPGGGLFGWGGRTGGAPTPFDAVDGHRLAGPDGSHPLAAVAMEELVAPCSDGLEGRIELTAPVTVGEGIAGRIVVTARTGIEARSATLRLLGVRLAEEHRSHDERDSEGRVTRTDRWIEVAGELFEELPFTEPVLPATLAAGQQFEAEFDLPAPRLGPPSAHLGPAILAWALEAHWDMPMRRDERVATLVEVLAHPGYLRSGAAGLAEGSLHDAWQTGGASIAVSPVPPIWAGTDVDVTVGWPGAEGGRGARLELQADIEAPNGVSRLVVWSTAIDSAALRAGTTVRIPVPADAPPTVAAHGVGVSYRIRALVDRAFQADPAVERSIAIM